MKRVFVTLGALCLAGCEVLDPPRATTLSAIQVPGDNIVAPIGKDSFTDLLMPYPAAIITERNQVPVGDYLRSEFKKAFPTAIISVKAWEPKAEVRGRFGPKVEMTLGFEILVQEGQRSRVVADYYTSEIGGLYVSHGSLTGLHSIDSREHSAPIHTQLRKFIDLIIEKVKWRLRETENKESTQGALAPRVTSP